MIQQARELLAKGELLAARERINAALRLAPTSVEVRELLGRSALAVGDAPTAARAFDEALRLGGRSAALHEGLALAQLGLGEPDAVVDAIPRRDGAEGARLDLLVAAAQSDRYESSAAQRTLDRVSQQGLLPPGTLARRRASVALRSFDIPGALASLSILDPSAGADALPYGQAAVAVLRGQLGEAEKALAAVLAQQPAHRPALQLRAALALDRQRTNPTRATASRADPAGTDVPARVLQLVGASLQGRVTPTGTELAQLEPLVLRVPTGRLRWRPQALIAGALVLDGLGRSRDALRWWTLAARQPGSPVAKRLARLALDERLAEDALRWLPPGSNAKVADPDVQLLQAAALSLQGRAGQALEQLRTLQTPSAHVLAGSLLLAEGRLPEASARLQRVEQEPSAQFALLHVDLRRGQGAAARQRVDSLLRRAPENPAYLHAAALQAWLQDNPSRAERLLDQALAVDADDLGAARSRMRLDVERNQFAAARARLKALTQAAPGHSELLMELAALALREGRLVEADAWLERAAEAARLGENRAALTLIDRRLRAGNAAGALAVAQRSMAPQRDGWLHHVVLAQTLEAAGQVDAARRELVLAGRVVGYARDELAVLADLQLDLGDLDGARYTLHKALSAPGRHAATLAAQQRLDNARALVRRSAKGQGLYGPPQLTAFDLDRWGRLSSLASLPPPDPLAAVAVPKDPQARLRQAWQDLAVWTDNGPVSSWWLIAAMDRTDDGRPLSPAPSLQAQWEYLAEQGLGGR